MQPISISSQIKEDSYLKLMFRLTYRRPMMIFCTIAGAGTLILSTLHITGLYMAADSPPPYFPLLFGLVIVFFVPLTTYRSSIRNFRSNQRLQEKINYQFDLEKMSVSGDSFNSEMSWEKTHRILELKHWILIYQDQQVANIIPKDAFDSEQWSKFKQMLREIPNLNIKLKK